MNYASIKIKDEQQSFLVKSVQFELGEKRTIYHDDGVGKYEQHWLDQQPDGKPEKQEPALFVRNTTVKATTVSVTPKEATTLDPANFTLRGEVTYRGAATNIVFTSGAGAKQQNDWVFQNLTAGNNKFTSPGYDPALSVKWTLVPTQGQGGGNRQAGRSENPAYVTFAETNVPAGTTFKMLRTFVHIGSAGADGQGIDTSEKMINWIWKKFSDRPQVGAIAGGGAGAGGLGPPAIKTWDNQPLVYYKTWTYYNAVPPQPEPETTSYGLVSGKKGDCTSFVRLLIDAIRAQGIEQDDDVVPVWSNRTTRTLTAAGVPIREFMFVGAWSTNGGGGQPNAGIPQQLEFRADYLWINTSKEISTMAGQELRYGWKLNNNIWQYVWDGGINQVVKDQPDTIAGQNNPTPLGIFAAHVLVKISIGGADVYFDPSYGRKFSSLKGWEDASVAFYGYRITPATLQNINYPVFYLLRQNPTAANSPADVVRDNTQLPANY